MYLAHLCFYKHILMQRIDTKMARKKEQLTPEEQYRLEREKQKAKASKRSMSKKSKKILQIVISVVLVVGVLAAYVGTGMIRGGLLSYFGVPQKTLTGMTISNDENSYKITPAQYNYYYATIYNNLNSTISMYKQYGLDAKSMGYDVDLEKPLKKQMKKTDDGKEITWAEYIEQQVQEQAKNIAVTYTAAVKANDNKAPELTEEEQKEIDDTMAKYKESADKYGFTLDAYLKKAIGKGVNEKLVREEMKKSIIAKNYDTSVTEKFDKTEYTVDQVNEYYEKNKTLMSSADFYVFEAKDEESAKKMADELKAAPDASFADSAVKYSEKAYDKEANANIERLTEKSLLKQTADSKYSVSAGKDGLDWLYSADRAAGDVASFKSVVFKMITPANQSSQPTVSIRHILIEPEVAEDAKAVDATAEQWAAAKAKADDIYSQWVKNGKTEDAFSTLATENTADEGSKESGGLIENAYPGQMVPEFNSWIFAQHKTGDCEIVKTDYGYHIIYFVSLNTTPYWQSIAVENLKKNAKEEEMNGSLESYKVKVNWFGSKFFTDDVALAS